MWHLWHALAKGNMSRSKGYCALENPLVGTLSIHAEAYDMQVHQTTVVCSVAKHTL